MNASLDGTYSNIKSLEIKKGDIHNSVTQLRFGYNFNQKLNLCVKKIFSYLKASKTS